MSLICKMFGHSERRMTGGKGKLHVEVDRCTRCGHARTTYSEWLGGGCYRRIETVDGLPDFTPDWTHQRFYA